MSGVLISLTDAERIDVVVALEELALERRQAARRYAATSADLAAEAHARADEVHQLAALFSARRFPRQEAAA